MTKSRFSQYLLKSIVYLATLAGFFLAFLSAIFNLLFVSENSDNHFLITIWQTGIPSFLQIILAGMALGTLLPRLRENGGKSQIIIGAAYLGVIFSLAIAVISKWTSSMFAWQVRAIFGYLLTLGAPGWLFMVSGYIRLFLLRTVQKQSGEIDPSTAYFPRHPH